MATTVLGLKTFTASDPVDYNEINDNYIKIDNGVKTVLQGRAAHNLLDNSNFSNPVNQRGQTSYSGIVYSIDRWRSWDSNNIITINNGSISVSAHIVQTIPKNCFKDGSAYTIALCALDGTIYANSGVYTPDGEDFGDWTHTWVVITDSGDVDINVRNGTYVWAALYEGSYDASTLPAYQPKGYAAELAECQRYYNVIHPYEYLYQNSYVAEYTVYSLLIQFPKMRIIPTIQVDGNIDGYNYQTDSSLRFYSTHPNSIVNSVTLSADL